MTDLFEQSSQKLDAAITEIQNAIATGMANKQRLFETMSQLYGEGSANGAWSQRDAFDLLEAALTRHMAGLLSKPQMLTQISEISALIEALPTHTVRSENQLRYQQFSTPADLAALSVILAQPLATDIVLEPSAGHGALVATLPDVRALHLNEIDPRRREKLALLFPQATTTGIDGAMLASHLDAAVQPSLILMNPPFSRSMGRGADEFAAVRHLRAAITRIGQGGRIVAIMPDWFTTSAKLAKIYDDTFASCTVRTSIRLDKCYHKQGTSVAVRLYVIDKIPGQTRPAVLARETVADVASAVPIIKRVTAQPDCEPRAVPPKTKPGALFKAMRATPITKPVKARAAQAPKIEALAFSTLDKPRVLGEQSGVYIPYRPSRIDIVGAREHPTPLVESVAMGSIPAPIPDYVPALQDRVLQESLLSEAQIETVIYAGNAWQQYLPGQFVPAEEGVGLQLDEQGRAYRKGYFLGDGTGAGKGRQIAACILDGWLAGRRKAIWVSKNESLLEDPSSIDPADKRDALRLSEKHRETIYEGDKVRWNEKDTARGLMKSEEARILMIKDGVVMVENRQGDTIELKQNDRMLERMGLAYALNMHQAQGDTRDMAIGEMHSAARNLSNQRLALVMMTRVRDDITIVTNDKDRLLSQIERNPGDKTSALETLGEKQVDEGKGKRTSAEFSPKIPEHLRAGGDSLAPLPNVARDSLRSVPQIDLPERSIERSR